MKEEAKQGRGWELKRLAMKIRKKPKKRKWRSDMDASMQKTDTDTDTGRLQTISS